MPHIVVQEDGALEPLMEWAVDLAAEESVEQSELWVDACTAIARFAVDKGQTGRFNVFLVFDNEELIEKRNRPALGRLIAIAHARTWGAPLLLVLSNAPWLASILRPSRRDLGEWMSEILLGNVADVIQIVEGYDWTNPRKFWTALRDGAVGSRERQAIMKALAGERSWCCALPSERDTLVDAFGAASIITSRDKKLDSDVLVVLKASESLHRSIAEIDRHLDDVALDWTRRCIVATYSPRPRPGLSEHCNSRRLPPPISVTGDFELWYLLLRLNNHAHAQIVQNNSVRTVPLASSPRLKIAKPAPTPSILITSVFPLEETSQLLAAAADVGELLRRIPAEMHYRVALAVDPPRLMAFLEDVQQTDPPNVWIHMGHGRGGDGLRIPGRGDVQPDAWVSCFYGKDLRLALFLACDSVEMARQFACDGSVGIGFDGQVGADEGRHVAIEVLKAILAHGTREETILEGFRSGLERYNAVHTSHARARAYYPRPS
jgi:hypothetical protein